MDLRESLIAARAAARRLAGLTGPERSHLLADFAAALARPEARTAVLEANAERPRRVAPPPTLPDP